MAKTLEKLPLELTVTLGILACLATIINTFIIYAFIRVKSIRRRRANKLVLSLILSDGITVWMMFAVSVVTHTGEEHFPFLLLCTTMVLLTSVLNLCSVTIDRFTAVVQPLRYNQIITTKFVTVSVLINWGIPTVMGSSLLAKLLLKELPHQHFNVTVPIILVSTAFLAMILLGISNTVIFLNIKRQLRSLPTVTVSPGNNGKRAINRQEIRAAYLCAFIFLSFTILWIPEIVSLFGWIYKNSSLMSTTLRITASLCLVCNAFVDIGLYVVMNRELRHALIRLVCPKWMKEMAAKRQPKGTPPMTVHKSTPNYSDTSSYVMNSKTDMESKF